MSSSAWRAAASTCGVSPGVTMLRYCAAPFAPCVSARTSMESFITRWAASVASFAMRICRPLQEGLALQRHLGGAHAAALRHVLEALRLPPSGQGRQPPPPPPPPRAPLARSTPAGNALLPKLPRPRSRPVAATPWRESPHAREAAPRRADASLGGRAPPRPRHRPWRRPRGAWPRHHEPGRPAPCTLRPCARARRRAPRSP